MTHECRLPFAVVLPAKLAASMGVDVARARRMPLALALLYFNAALQMEGMLTRWADARGAEAVREGAALQEHLAALRAAARKETAGGY